MIFSPTLVLIILLALSVGGNALLGRLYVGAEREAAREKQARESFIAAQAELGREAARRAGMQIATDLRNKERADEENRKRIAVVTADVRRLRDERDDARRRLLSAAPAGSRCPDGQACFDRAELERAYGTLVQGVRELADEGTAVTIDLDTAKKWARRAGP